MPANKENKTKNLSVHQLIEEKTKEARKEEILLLYDQLLESIWNKILPVLGKLTVEAIAERALAMTKNKHPMLQHLEITPRKISLDRLNDIGDSLELKDIRAALQDYVTQIINILAVLTGEILIKQLLIEIEGKL